MNGVSLGSVLMSETKDKSKWMIFLVRVQSCGSCSHLSRKCLEAEQKNHMTFGLLAMVGTDRY